MFNNQPFNRGQKNNKDNYYNFYSSCKNSEISVTSVNAIKIKIKRSMSQKTTRFKFNQEL